MTKLAVILPSRGLIFSKTVEELYRELDGLDFKIFWSHGRPIPDCFEIPTREALKDKSFTHLLTVEEDMIIPKGAIGKMLKASKHAIAYDYPVTGSPSGTVLYDMDGTAFFTGCGILLVDMNIVRRMVFPIWRVDIAWGMKLFADRAEFNIKPGRKEDYGQQDIAFGLRLYINNIPLHVIGETGQRKLVKRGEGMTNQGQHEIIEYSEVKRQDYLNGQTANSEFIEIKVGDRILNMHKPVAEKLIAEGKAKNLNIRNARFHNLESIEDWVWLKSS